MTWEFNQQVAKIYRMHVRQHIPNYERVISKSVDICKKFCDPNDAILDFGCATGETLEILHANSFNNLHGVDVSQSMLELCNTKIANFTLGNTIPAMPYKAVLANWVLHFNQNKLELLANISKNTEVLVLSDKTSELDLPLEFYHKFKMSRGVSEQEVREKTESLKGVMFINPEEWYLSSLRKVGFKEVYIVDADWCFTTFLAIK